MHWLVKLIMWLLIILVVVWIIGVLYLGVDCLLTNEYNLLAVVTWGHAGKRPPPPSNVSTENFKEGVNYLPPGRRYGGYWGGFYRRPWMPWYWRTYNYPLAWRYIAYPSTSAYNVYGTPGLQTYYL